MAPISAEVLPALCPNEVNGRAEALGKTKLWQHKKNKYAKDGNEYIVPHKQYYQDHCNASETWTG
jgi:hypothetical protein